MFEFSAGSRAASRDKWNRNVRGKINYLIYIHDALIFHPFLFFSIVTSSLNLLDLYIRLIFFNNNPIL